MILGGNMREIRKASGAMQTSGKMQPDGKAVTFIKIRPERKLLAEALRR